MPAPFSDGGACGAIRYECSAEPMMSFNCHCRDCQRASGSAYLSAMVVPTTALTLRKGEPQYHAVRANSGHTTMQGFCTECGSVVLGKVAESPDMRVVIAASLDDSSWHQPTMDFWTASAQPWDFLNPALQKFDTEPAE